MQNCLSTLISLIRQGYKNFPSKTQRAQQRQVQPEAQPRAVPPCYGPEMLSMLALSDRRMEGMVPSLLAYCFPSSYSSQVLGLKCEFSVQHSYMIQKISPSPPVWCPPFSACMNHSSQISFIFFFSTAIPLLFLTSFFSMALMP